MIVRQIRIRIQWSWNIKSESDGLRFWLAQSHPQIIILRLITMYMVMWSWRGHCESSPSSFDECRLSAGWPPTLRPNQPTWPVTPPVSCYHPHSPSPFITQPERWYSFYCYMDSGRLSRLRHCSKAVHRSGCCDKHNCPWPLTPQSHMLVPLDHCNLQRQMGVNNLPKVVTRQRGSRKSNSQPSSCKSNALTTRLPSHHGASSLSGVPIYASAFAGTHWAYPWKDGQDELILAAGYIPRSCACPNMIMHPSTNWAQYRGTSLIKTVCYH